MFVIAVTGVMGTGKSALARRLQIAGHRAVSTDGDPLLCSWTTTSGRPVQRPERPDADWLAEHRWVWNAHRLDEFLTYERRAGASVVWLCGRADNQTELADRLDLVLLLEANEATIRDRLRDPTRGNDFGSSSDRLAAALADRTALRERWRPHGAVPIDATDDLDAVLERVLLAGARHLLRKRQAEAGRDDTRS